jgi:hypothetical protein
MACEASKVSGSTPTMDRDVLLSGFRIAHDHDARGDVRSAVVLVVGRQRQDLRNVHRRAMHDLLGLRGFHLLPRHWIGRRLLEMRQHFAGLDAHRLGHPAAVGNEAGHHRDRMTAGLRKQGGALAVEPLGVGRELELQTDLRLQHGQAAAGGEMVEPVPQAADRLRRVGLVDWHLVLGHGMKMYHPCATRDTDRNNA